MGSRGILRRRVVERCRRWALPGPVAAWSDEAVPSDPLTDWFLAASERGNAQTRVRPWTEGNEVRALVHGRDYFPVLAEAIAGTRRGDLILFADWRGDPDEKLEDNGPTIARALADAAGRGVLVKGLVWRSHLDRFRFSSEQNRDLTEEVNDAGGEVLLDQRVRPFGSHHQKFVVIRHEHDAARDVAFVGGIDLAHSRRDDAGHGGDEQTQRFARAYGGSPAWHDAQVEIRGPAVKDVEDVFRERWEDPAAPSRLPWQAIPDMLRGHRREPSHLPRTSAAPPASGTCAVQLLRTYPNRRPGYPFAADGERSVACGYTKALRRARRLVYVEDQYLWSTDVARVFAEALEREPALQVVAVVPRFPNQDSPVGLPAALLGHLRALSLVREAGGERMQVFDVENHDGEPVYVHAKVCIVDDVWATVGSDNLNRRSWTHDSELTSAVLDSRIDPREPTDPAGLGDGARRFARDLRLRLFGEHLDHLTDEGLLDPADAVEAAHRSAWALEEWYLGGCTGPRPRGRLRPHRVSPPPRWSQVLLSPAYRMFIDPDGRPPRMKLRRAR